MFKHIPPYLDNIVESGISLFQESREDRSRLSEIEWKAHTTEWSRLGEVVVWSHDIVGYITRVENTAERKLLIKELSELALDENLIISTWIDETIGYDRYRAYIDSIELLRVEALKYLFSENTSTN